MKFKIGHGYDVHRLVPERKLMIGGVEIPYEKGLLGHSDADVLCHAVADALLGAAGMKDIGYHFPDSDQRFENVSGAFILGKVKEMISQNGYSIINIDATVVAQAPKIAQYIDEMRKNIATALALDIEAVNVKATTEEKLGFTGSGEGIAAHAVCLITK